MTDSWDLQMAAHAKINLGLYILGKREDGYHDIWTVFQELEFHDTLFFSTTGHRLRISSDHPALPLGEENLVYRAVQRLSQQTGCPDALHIHIQKNIPLGAGLGGGSSNAAAALSGMNELFRIGLSQGELAEIGAELGSDVPFFCYGGTAIGTGRGEKIRPLPDFQGKWVALINPGIHVSTRWAYKNLKLKLTKIPALITLLQQANGTAGITEVHYSQFQNMLENPVMQQYPILHSIKAHFLASGAEAALMSGSGSTVFGLFACKESGENALQQLEQPGWLRIMTTTKWRRTHSTL